MYMNQVAITPKQQTKNISLWWIATWRLVLGFHFGMQPRAPKNHSGAPANDGKSHWADPKPFVASLRSRHRNQYLQRKWIKQKGKWQTANVILNINKSSHGLLKGLRSSVPQWKTMRGQKKNKLYLTIYIYIVIMIVSTISGQYKHQNYSRVFLFELLLLSNSIKCSFQVILVQQQPRYKVCIKNLSLNATTNEFSEVLQHVHQHLAFGKTQRALFFFDPRTGNTYSL